MNINTYKFSCEIMAKIAAHEWSTTDIADAIDKHDAAHDDAIRRETKEEYRSILETVVGQTRRECADMMERRIRNNYQDWANIATAIDDIRAFILAPELAREES